MPTMPDIPIHGYPVALALIAIAIGAALWHYERLHRFSSWLFAFAGFMLAVGIVPWFHALASLVTSGPGVALLVVVVAIGGLVFWHEAVSGRKSDSSHGKIRGAALSRPSKHHHRVRTPVIAAIFGTALLLLVGDFHRIAHKATKSPGKTFGAIGQSISQIQHGHISHGTQNGEIGIVLLAAGGILFGLILLAYRIETKRGRTARALKARNGGKSRSRGNAIPSAGAPRGLTMGGS